MTERKSIYLDKGAEVFEWHGRACLKYNAKLKVAGDSVKVLFYEDGIMLGFPKKGNELLGKPSTYEKIEYTSEERAKRFKRTNANAKVRLHDLVKSNLSKHKCHNGKKQSFKFLTLTFRNDITDLKIANKEFNAFIKRLNYHFLGCKGSFLRWVAVPELQESNGRGVWHYHVLLFNMPFLPVSWQMVERLIDEGKLNSDFPKSHTIAYIWGNGGVDVKAIKFDDGYNVAQYLASYIGKGLEGDFKVALDKGLLYSKRFLKSEGLLSPLVLIAFMSKMNRQDVYSYLKAHAKRFAKKGKKVHFDSFNFTAEWVGNVFGFDCRVPIKHADYMSSVFYKFNHGLT